MTTSTQDHVRALFDDARQMQVQALERLNEGDIFYTGIPGFQLVAGVSQFSPDADTPIKGRKRYKRASPPAKPRLGGQPAAQYPHTPRRPAFGQPSRSTTSPGSGTARSTLQYGASLEEGSPPSSTRPMRTAQTTSCCRVLNPSFLWTAETALRTVNPLLFLISPIS